MPVEYKYKDEDVVIFSPANNYKIAYEPDPTRVLEWQALGRFYDIENQRTDYWIVTLFDDPNLEIVIDTYYQDLKDHIVTINLDTGEEMQGRMPSFTFYTNKGERGINRFTNNDASYQSVDDQVTNQTKQPGIRFSEFRLGASTIRNTKVETYGYDSQQRLQYKLIPTVSNFQLVYTHPSQVVHVYPFRIFNFGGEVFSRTEDYPPEYVKIIGIECPPNTCPVKCGENVCCYNSNGISEESFLFSESVYQ